ncbi:Uncharacterised protein [Vibrio cholerae]|nr:Uncharacterised protein [Vibrio cholerae]
MRSSASHFVMDSGSKVINPAVITLRPRMV